MRDAHQPTAIAAHHAHQTGESVLMHAHNVACVVVLVHAGADVNMKTNVRGFNTPPAPLNSGGAVLRVGIEWRARCAVGRRVCLHLGRWCCMGYPVLGVVWDAIHALTLCAHASHA